MVLVQSHSFLFLKYVLWAYLLPGIKKGMADPGTAGPGCDPALDDQGIRGRQLYRGMLNDTMFSTFGEQCKSGIEQTTTKS